MIKKMKVLSLIIALYSVLVISSFADIVSTEIIDVDGTQIEVTYFIENGIQCESMKVLEAETPKSLSKPLNQDVDLKVKKKTTKIEILNKAETIFANNMKNNEAQKSSMLMISSPFWQTPKSFSVTGYCPQTSNVLVTSLGSFNATNISPFHLKLYGGYYKGLYSGAGVADQILVRETYTKTSAGISWSIPPSIEIQTDTGSTMQVSVSNTDTLKAYRETVEANSLFSILSLTVTSESTVVIGSTAYSANVSIGKSVWNF